MAKLTLDMNQYLDTARRAVAEGQVLLKNDNKVLPLNKDCKVAVFGRIQTTYYKSGTGSGGMVNVTKVTGILDALLESDDVIVNKQLLSVYQEWEKEHPFNEGIGWGNEPSCQEEMPLTDELVCSAAKESDVALVIIGRTAGEDKDNVDEAGCYRFTELEEQMMEAVRKHFDKVVVVLNVGNIIDMSFVDTYQPDAVLYAWQGGMVGGLGTVDVLTGKVSPSGKLTDTIAYEIKDYPSDKNFGNMDTDLYEEDIYVGYRYFETVAKDKVRYPFGYGLSYTDFSIQVKEIAVSAEQADFTYTVTNTGHYAGKEVVQVYVEAPQGKLGKPARSLAGYAKTKELMPGEAQDIEISVPFYTIASYDDSGVTGYRSSYVLEEGEYKFYVGTDVRADKSSGAVTIEETEVVETLTQALAPVTAFSRMKPVVAEDGTVTFVMEEVPLREIPLDVKRKENLPAEIPQTEDKGYKLSDVKAGKVSMGAFVAQMSDEDLACMVRGEGMGSPKVTAGTAAAFGGVSDHLMEMGIPCGCCADGPSGMRMDSGAKAFSLPNGTLLASSFNDKLVEELYAFTGIEMVKNKIEALLGPGMNIHRHPLNGRNFEYFSEDPLITGKMAAAMIRGLKSAGVTGTAKHFCSNNQEKGRSEVNCVISERALREIYLKGFEIAVKEAKADSIMTTYGSVNGLWTAGSYDLNTTILRGEWGFQGIVMTDWWAKINDEGCEANKTNYAAMVRSQNDLYMVCEDAAVNSMGDNTLSSLEAGTLARSELQRSAMNVCGFLMNSRAFERMQGEELTVEVLGGEDAADEQNEELVYYKAGSEITIDLEGAESSKGSNYVFALELDSDKIGYYDVELVAKSDLGELAQIPVSLIYQSLPVAVFAFNGTGGKWTSLTKRVDLPNRYDVLRLYFSQNGLEVKEIKFTFKEPHRAV